MNNKGFTLSELIVTMALVGVVLAISFPAIAKLQSENQNQVYIAYEKALLNAAKLYVDKYGRDLWKSPVLTETCVIITYGNLEYEDLIKEFDGIKKNEIVDKESTYIKATKKDTSVKYEVSFATKQNGNQYYKNIKDKGSCGNNSLPPND